MRTFARIAAGVVAELITIAPEGPPLTERYHPDLVATMTPVPDGGGVAAGWAWDGEAFAAPPAAAAIVPPVITRRQLLLALASAGLITGAEALAAATSGAVPALIDVIFGALPAPEALAARITWATMTVVERQSPLISALIAADVATHAAVDALFTAGAGM